METEIVENYSIKGSINGEVMDFNVIRYDDGAIHIECTEIISLTDEPITINWIEEY